MTRCFYHKAETVIFYLYYLQTYIAAVFSAINDKFMIVVETSPVNGIFISYYYYYYYYYCSFQSIAHWIQRLCCSHTFVSDIPMFRNNSNLLHLLMPRKGAQ
jgi:hypothetical protein